MNEHHLLQDCNKGLSRWLASRPDAMRNADLACMDIQRQRDMMNALAPAKREPVRPGPDAKYVHVSKEWRPTSFERRHSDGRYECLMRGTPTSKPVVERSSHLPAIAALVIAVSSAVLLRALA